MKLKQLLERVETINGENIEDAEISYITDDSRKVVPGCAFVCIQGRSFDGHTAALAAQRAGAAVVVAQRDTGAENQVLVSDTRAAYSLMCSAFFGNPCDRLKIIGVTGTNGKTTVCFCVKNTLEALGIDAGLIGTVKNVAGGEEYPAALTTPDAFELHGLFKKMADAGSEYCVMEVSSQALEQRRVEGVHFEVAVFTNLTRDHLDYHGSFENYAAAKHMLFENAGAAVVNIDDEYAHIMAKDIACPVVTYSTRKDSADYTAKNINIRSTGTEYEMVGEGVIGRVRFKTPGRFSVYNSMAAIITLTLIGIPFSKAVGAMALTAGVPGRLEVVPTNRDFTVVIDYAHTPDGLKNVLEALRETSQGRIITVFGCGGDRDKTKRPLMGETAAEYSDIAIVTSDNPRTENPDSIVGEVFAGIVKPRAKVYCVTDRTEAIEKALKKAREGDVVLLAGKGHETYQIIGTQKNHYDEREIVAQLLS